MAEKLLYDTIDNIHEQKINMCYDSAKLIIDTFSNNYNKDIETFRTDSHSKFIKFVNNYKFTNNMVIYVELKIGTVREFSPKEKIKLAKKYKIDLSQGFSKFAFKNKNIRPFLHAFNIIIIDGKIHYGQSWKDVYKYTIYKGHPINNLKKWFSNLSHRIHRKPSRIYRQLDPARNYSKGYVNRKMKNNKKIMKMIEDEKLDYNYEIIFKAVHF